jgi:phosphoglycerate dehydrogenase-like enzyme
VTDARRALPPRGDLRIVFAHAAYRFTDPFNRRKTGLSFSEVHTHDDLARAIPDAHVVIVSGLWKNDLLARANKLAFVQSISAGTDQYDKARFRELGVRLANAQGVNAQAVAEHAMALLLGLTRQTHLARDNQAVRSWPPMNSDVTTREEVIAGKTMLIVGLGDIGRRVARFAKAFGMTVLATRRDAAQGAEGVDEVHANAALADLLPRADVVVLTCPLTPETENLIDGGAFARMRPGTYLVNVARGKVVDEDALIAALAERRLAGAGIDVTRVEPLAADSKLWSFPNALITPHRAGETRAYEEDLITILLDNIDRLLRGEDALRNQIV